MKARLLVSRRSKLVALFLGSAVAVFNCMVYQQAYRFTHYVPDTYAVPQLEKISLGEKFRFLFTGLDVPRPVNQRTPDSVGLSYAVHRIPITKDEHLEGWLIPHSKPSGLVMMFPGYAASKVSLILSAKTFHDLGYSTFLVDFRGAGGSTGSNTTLGVREGMDVVEAVRYAKSALLPKNPLILYGFSMGSAAILRAIATDDIQPDAIILEHPFDSLLNTTRNRFAAIQVPSFPTAELLVIWGSIQQGYNGFDLNPIEWASRANCPVLIFHGGRDVRITKEQSYRIYERIGVSHKQFVTSPDVGHEMFAEVAPQTWTDHITSFLKLPPISR